MTKKMLKRRYEMAKVKNKGLMAKTGMGIGVLLFLLLMPLTALATEYTSLGVITRALRYPTDMAVSSVDGTVYVVDGFSQKVLTYDGLNRYKGSITAVESPLAVAVSPAGTVYLADNKTKSVKIINPATGQVSGSLMKDGVMATFSLPRNIAVGPDNTVYVIDQLAESIEIFSAANTYSDSITGLPKPQDAAAQSIIDPDTGEVLEAKLYIIDQPVIQDGSTINDPQDDGTLNGSRIQVYDLLTGSLDEDHAFPSFGSDSDLGEYINPIGIGIDSQGYIYVSDSFLHVVFQYNPADTDTPVGSFTTGNVIDDSLSTPLGLTVSADGRLFVTSSFDGSVKIYGVDAIAGAGSWMNYGVDAIAGAGSWMNESPVADAGPDQTVGEDTTFVLDGSGSTDGDGILSYTWTQVNGSPVWETPSVTSDSPTVTVAANTLNVAPEGEILSFQLIVEDVYSKASSPSTTNVTVNNVYTGSITINGGDTYTNNPNVTLTLDSDDADEMRFANDSDPFNGDYDGYAASKDWTLTDFDDSMEENDSKTQVGILLLHKAVFFLT
jgi:hypothetical protein